MQITPDQGPQKVLPVPLGQDDFLTRQGLVLVVC